MSAKKYKRIKLHILLYTLLVAFALCFTETANASEATSSYTYYQNLLNENELKVYNQIYDMAMSFNDSMFPLCIPLSEPEMERTINSFYFDHPELYWVNTTYKYALNKSEQVIKFQLQFGISSEELVTANTIIENELNTIVAAAMAEASDIEKERCIHDYICSNTSYSVDAKLNQSAYSALTSPYSVCAGYARAFQIACERVGIPCYYVTGTSKGVNHAWNIVYIDGKYYNVDLTWDDVIAENYSKPSYVYFNKTDATFAADHTRSDYAVLLPVCN
ncbi:Transglutaminase-like superfamily protein [Pseudobutyrivibrio sp. OR37]|uniref:transglutaminase domain-containing protein n=1 Tax=Pseudobutyrivibrio sp. OR37 TaxID=1798186 RepID=UPI0008E832EF|nr:transglutaminase domain-containing protein [Pseudobutyrivibrio sp. OR37]SFH79098.1 Transglutaminase-like superfamily protein [Pseudobutyrivibrio sp. OR37]